MADKYKEYLATRIFTENQVVTYRLLSRAVGVNVNTAKCMLFEFYDKQNAKKPNAVHATFILVGQKKSFEHTNGSNGSGHRKDEDIRMRSSPPLSSMPEPDAEPEEEIRPTKSIVLVREEELEDTKAKFDKIESQHIYSLQPGPIENLNLLSACNHEIATSYSTDDPLERWKKYGSIHNPFIKKRTAKHAPVATSIAAKATTTAVKSDVLGLGRNTSKDTPVRKGTSEGNTSGRSTPQPAAAASTTKKTGAKPALQKQSSDIFKSFAKAKPKAKEPAPAPVEDEPMQGMSEDEGEDEEKIEIDHEKEAAARKVRAEREEALRKMMEESEDDEMPDAPIEEPEAMETQPEEPVDETPAGTEAAVTTEGGRRRGRRRVLKKKKVKDDDGYLVTKEEAVWESFSEDEPAPKKPKPAPKPSTAKGKNVKVGKGGQGSIASFFKKA
ncbi:hypothetical protein BU24DRAFT_419514 [Aaosphaeria arxii CBS 175.79]|uniref:DNA polymerase delta subunit 3 n=1 Tax=Aaosphaeria arxii CBS 175.79 TaxID=1450172 RepID=A0A6A5Y3Z5_9PLEO|nr:uncharacterized protein BU24DRAFT_419514 [Aaosphaeria arxii CBS 175.79]KAF2019913.1 hypothetical protein BU24DRAFT_419514 [Aaosphaeria arxii CBS 175.79]